MLFEEESKNTDDTLKSYIEYIHRLETNNMNLKSKLTRSEAEAAKVTLENQKLMQVSNPLCTNGFFLLV